MDQAWEKRWDPQILFSSRACTNPVISYKKQVSLILQIRIYHRQSFVSSIVANAKPYFTMFFLFYIIRLDVVHTKSLSGACTLTELSALVKQFCKLLQRCKQLLTRQWDIRNKCAQSNVNNNASIILPLTLVFPFEDGKKHIVVHLL